MAIVFPASPSVNDTFTAGSITYKWDGAKWIGLGVTPADRLVEGSNSLEINASNDLVWTGDKVGLGIDTPAEKLEVYGNGRFKATDGSHGIELYPDVGGLGYQRIISFNRTSSAYENLSIGVNDFIVTNGSSSEALRITSGGQVGIGTDNPGFQLSIHGTDAVRNQIVCTNNNAAGAGINLKTMNGGSTVSNVTLHTNTTGDLLIWTGTSGASERLRIDSAGLITQGGKTASNHGSPNLLLWGADTTLHISSTEAVNNSSSVGIKFAVAGGSTGDYSKAGIFVQRQDSYNDLDMIFAFRSTNDAAGVAISDEKLRITSDGYVTKPLQPAFRAGRLGNYTPGASTDIVFNSVAGTGHHNIGSHYSTSTGKFTAPVAGIYIFAVHIIWQSIGNGQVMDDAFSMYINSNVAAYSWSRRTYTDNVTGVGGYFTDFGTYQFQLAANQTVSVQNRRGSIVVHGNQLYSTFSGYLLG